MNSMTTEAGNELRMHADSDGCIFITEGAAPLGVLHSLEDIKRFPIDGRRIRLLGTQQNASLICRLYERAPSLLQLASPAPFATASYRKRPEMLLQQLGSIQLPASLGGWHQATPADYLSYQLCEMTRLQLSIELSHVERHPAWVPLSFIPEMDPPVAARLIAELLDPRWYIDVVHPDRRCKLFSYMGMNDNNMWALYDSSHPRGRYCDRAQLVVQAWTGRRNMQLSGEFYDGKKHKYDHPGQFLLRGWCSGSKGARGMLRVSQRLLEFLSSSWLDRLTANGDSLFVPRYFFHDEADAEAYLDHVTKAG